MRMRDIATAVILAVAPIGTSAHEAPPLRGSSVPLPAPGTYQLQRIMRAPGGTVVDETGRSQQLARYTRGKITLLSFVYTRCGDACPLAMGIEQMARQQLEHSAALRGRVRFVTISIDPGYDTPAVMKKYGSNFMSPTDRVPWLFMTTRFDRQLRPLLDGFDQDVDAAEGTASFELTHVLKVFLIDPVRNVREIYSTAFLTPEVLINDIKTLAKEEGVAVD